MASDDLTVNIRITPPDAFSPEKVKRGIANSMRKVAFHLEGAAKDNITPFTRTGRLRSSVTSRSTPNQAVIGTNVDYARAVEDGSRPHKIYPRNKKALAFSVGGRKVVVKSVNHPGFKGHRYMRRTLEGNVDDVKRIVVQEIERALP